METEEKSYHNKNRSLKNEEKKNLDIKKMSFDNADLISKRK